MIHYTPQNQLKLDLFENSFKKNLNKGNRWAVLAELIPWDELAAVYSKKLSSNSGRKSVNVRTVIAALIIKHKLRLDDRGTVEMIQENLYLQYFCGPESFTTKAVFDPSLFVDIRKRMGGCEFDAFNRIVIEKSENLKPHRFRGQSKESNGDGELPQNRGALKADATVADLGITYPTDLKLLNECRENQKRIIDLLYGSKSDRSKPRTYRQSARQAYLTIAKKKRKSRKVISRGIKQQLSMLVETSGIQTGCCP